MIRRVAVAFLFCGLSLLIPKAAGAQNLSDLLVTLIQSEVELAPPAAGQSHAAHFEPGASQQIAPFFFNQEMVAQLATFPIGSSSGGFSYTLDPASGTFRRTASSFGPSFAERAATNGHGKLSVGANFQYSNYTSFEGTSLDNGDVKFFLGHSATCTPKCFFEGDLIQAALKLKLSSSTTTVFANYGVNDRWDVAVALPFVHVSIDATVDATVLRFATGENSTIHQFVGGSKTATFTSAGSASGVGDVLLRTKYRFVTTPTGGLAGGLDIRVPTGDAKNLLGTGAVQATFTLIGSTTYDKFAPHFNLGISKSRPGTVVNIPTEVDYRIGTEYAWKPTVTFNADLLGRSLRDAGRLEAADTVHTFTSAAGVPGSTTLRQFQQVSGSLNLTTLALGGKFNIKDNYLVSGNVLIALTSSGVTARVTPVIGIDYSF